MNVKKERKEGICGAMRCTSPATVTVPGILWDLEGERIGLCDRHHDQAEKEYQLSEIPDAVEILVPKATPAAEAVVEVTPEASDGEVKDGESLATEVAAATDEAKDALALARTMSIQTQEDLEFAAEVLAEAKGAAKKLKERLDAITKPLNQALKSARDLFRPALDHYGTIEDELKKRIAEVKLRLDEENQAALNAAAAAHAAGDAAGTEAAIAQVKTLGNVAGLGARFVWGFQVVDVAQIPREFLVPNEAAIRAFAQGYPVDGPAPALPGVTFEKKVVVSSRSA